MVVPEKPAPDPEFVKKDGVTIDDAEEILAWIRNSVVCPKCEDDFGLQVQMPGARCDRCLNRGRILKEEATK
jgi:hypothetical protein